MKNEQRITRIKANYANYVRNCIKTLTTNEAP